MVRDNARFCSVRSSPRKELRLTCRPSQAFKIKLHQEQESRAEDSKQLQSVGEQDVLFPLIWLLTIGCNVSRRFSLLFYCGEWRRVCVSKGVGGAEEDCNGWGEENQLIPSVYYRPSILVVFLFPKRRIFPKTAFFLRCLIETKQTYLRGHSRVIGQANGCCFECLQPVWVIGRKGPDMFLQGLIAEPSVKSLARSDPTGSSSSLFSHETFSQHLRPLSINL